MDLIRGRLGSDGCGHADQGHGEERRKLVEVGLVVELPGGLTVAERMAKCSGEPFDKLDEPTSIYRDDTSAMKQATEQMQLGGQFATHVTGFDR